MNDLQVFVSFDVEHDGDVHRRLSEQAGTPGLHFTVSGSSARYAATSVWTERVRQQIRESDQVIVICGEHTDQAMGVLEELRIAQEENKPYFLLWGRRESMCKKPEGAKTSEGIFSWTLPILSDQILRASRVAERSRASGPRRRRSDEYRSAPLLSH